MRKQAQPGVTGFPQSHYGSVTSVELEQPVAIFFKTRDPTSLFLKIRRDLNKDLSADTIVSSGQGRPQHATPTLRQFVASELDNHLASCKDCRRAINAALPVRQTEIGSAAGQHKFASIKAVTATCAAHGLVAGPTIAQLFLKSRDSLLNPEESIRGRDSPVGRTRRNKPGPGKWCR